MPSVNRITKSREASSTGSGVEPFAGSTTRCFPFAFSLSIILVSELAVPNSEGECR